jgi:Helicase conserved C-terminal domain/SNF2-related domain
MAFIQKALCSEGSGARMAKIKEIRFAKEHAYQSRVCRHVRSEFMRRLKRDNTLGGFVLADGVGLGKTYEALGTTVSLLSQMQHRKQRKKRKSFSILVLVPPSLVSKWADELILPDRFKKYLKDWSSPQNRAIAKTFSDVVVLRKYGDLKNKSGQRRYGRNVLPAGLYIVNSKILEKTDRKVTQIRRTMWDVVIIDEAHHIANTFSGSLNDNSWWRRRKTAVLLLTATPFQLSPQEMKGLFSATFAGNNDPIADATNLYGDERFKSYRYNISRYFKAADEIAAKNAGKLRTHVRNLLLPRIVRNQKRDNRIYYVVDESGEHEQLASPFGLNDEQLGQFLSQAKLIRLTEDVTDIYLRERDEISEAASRKTSKPFVSAALRQLLSSWQQYKTSSFGRDPGRRTSFTLPSVPHPKVQAVSKLVRKLMEKEASLANSQRGIGKILIFTTYVGSDGDESMPLQERVYGTAATLKRELTRQLFPKDGSTTLFPRPGRLVRDRIKAKLQKVVSSNSRGFSPAESRRLQTTLATFSGSSAAGLTLSDDNGLAREARELTRLLQAAHAMAPESGDEPVGDAVNYASEKTRRAAERRKMLFHEILDRYSTRDLVARYDGATRTEERDRHLRGFNSPFAPFVLLASSVGQEGIDLQKFCRHVVHYDLEWNPAKLEQREGRVDRQGRETNGAVNVYFLLCRDTYDERLMHVMVNRFRWHQVLLGNKHALEGPPGKATEESSDPTLVKKMRLDLSPP